LKLNGFKACKSEDVKHVGQDAALTCGDDKIILSQVKI